MRPVDKGEAPKASYVPYGDALDDLLQKLGPYCSYCEQVISNAPEIEHVQPKSLVPGLENDWDNFLLACKSCNSTKGSKSVDLNHVAFPDMDNTFRALDYYSDGEICVTEFLEDDHKKLMQATVDLVKLHRHPQASKPQDRPSRRDRRALYRMDALDIARLHLAKYEGYSDKPENVEILRDIIADQLAPAKGFFSVWMTVFSDHPKMLRRFIAAFPGTDSACFNEKGQPLPRPDGRF